MSVLCSRGPPFFLNTWACITVGREGWQALHSHAEGGSVLEVVWALMQQERAQPMQLLEVPNKRQRCELDTLVYTGTSHCATKTPEVLLRLPVGGVISEQHNRGLTINDLCFLI